MSYPHLFVTGGFGPIAAEIDEERARQDKKFGQQDWPDIDPRDIAVATRGYWASRAKIWRDVNAERAEPSTGPRCLGDQPEPHIHTAWDGILLEEVYEALAESDPAKLRAELIQVAAVAVAWVQAIDRRGEEAGRG